MTASVSAVRSPEELSGRFRARGLKVTPQRQCIFGVLALDHSHPTAESVHAAASARMPAISLKTVYQTLNDLAAMGEILQLDLGTGASRFDPNIEQRHHHLVCERCGKVRDLDADFGDLRIPPRARQGFRLGSAEITFRGLCATCTDESSIITTPKERHG